jgi:hypothetical protein
VEQERNEKLQPPSQAQHQGLALKLVHQIGFFPVEYRVEGVFRALIEEEVWVVIIINKRIIVE